MSARKRTVKLRGVVSAGIQKSALFTEIPWVKKMFVERLGVNPHPGTFNVTVVPEDLDKLERIKKAKGIALPPEDPAFCAGRGFPVLVGGRIRGAAILPDVTDYPPAQLEIISSERIRTALGLEEGDPVDIEVYL